MPQVPDHVLELYKNGGMDSTQMDEFESLVTSGDLTLPQAQAPTQPQSQTPVQEQQAQTNPLQRYLPQGVELETPGPSQPVNTNGPASTTAAYVEPEPEFRPIQGMDTTQEEWPRSVNINGQNIPVLKSDKFFEYQTRALSDVDRYRIEDGVKDGTIALPPGKKLNIPVPEHEKHVGERVSNVLTGKDREANQYPDVLTAPELGLTTSLIGSMTGKEEQLKIVKAKGFTRGPNDFFGNPILISPKGKKYSIPTGLSPMDLVGAGLLIAPGVLTGGAGAGATLGARALIQGGIEVGLETALQSLQASQGGDFDVIDVVLAGGSAVGAEYLFGLKGAMRSNEIKKLLKKANKGDQASKDALDIIQTKYPKEVDLISESLDIKYSQGGKIDSTKPKRTIDEGLALVAKDDSPEAMEEFASVFGIDKEVIQNAKDQGVLNKLTSKQVISKSDKEGRQLFSSIDDGRLSGDADFNADELSEDLFNKIETIGGSRDLGEVSRNIKEIEEGHLDRLQYGKLGDNGKRIGLDAKGKPIDDAIRADLGSDVLYDRVSSTVSENTFAKGENVLKELNKIIKQRRKTPKSYPGFEKISKTASDMSFLTPLEKKAYIQLQPDIYAPTGQKILSGRIKGQTPDVKKQYASYHSLDALRKEFGAAIKESTFTSTEQGRAKHLYDFFLEDQDEALKSLDKAIGTNARADWKMAKTKVKLRKKIEDSMVGLFGKEINQEFTSSTRAAFSDVSDTAMNKLITMTKRIPKDNRKEFVASGIIQAIKDSGEKDASVALWNFWKKAKDSKKAMAYFKDNLTDEGFKHIEEWGNIGKNIELAKKNLKGKSLASINDIIEPKIGFVRHMLNTIGVYGGAGIVSTAVIPIVGSSLGIGLGILGAFKAFGERAIGKKMAKFMDLMNSKEMTDYLVNPRETQVYLKKLSKTKQMKNFVKAAGMQDTSPAGIEKFIKTSMKSGARVDRNTGTEE